MFFVFQVHLITPIVPALVLDSYFQKLNCFQLMLAVGQQQFCSCYFCAGWLFLAFRCTHSLLV